MCDSDCKKEKEKEETANEGTRPIKELSTIIKTSPLTVKPTNTSTNVNKRSWPKISYQEVQKEKKEVLEMNNKKNIKNNPKTKTEVSDMKNKENNSKPKNKNVATTPITNKNKSMNISSSRINNNKTKLNIPQATTKQPRNKKINVTKSSAKNPTVFSNGTKHVVLNRINEVDDLTELDINDNYKEYFETLDEDDWMEEDWDQWDDEDYDDDVDSNKRSTRSVYAKSPNQQSKSDGSTFPQNDSYNWNRRAKKLPKSSNSEIE